MDPWGTQEVAGQGGEEAPFDSDYLGSWKTSPEASHKCQMKIESQWYAHVAQS